MEDDSKILEEYKFLREETKSFTDQSLRDLQMFLGILAILITLSSITPNLKPSEESVQTIKIFWYFAIIQAATFIFLVVQFIKIIYILEIRRHLRDLENVLNSEINNREYHLKWETLIVPTRLASKKSYIIHAQIVLGFMYGLFFCVIVGSSCFHIHEIQTAFRRYYFGFVIFEFIFLIYSVFRIIRIQYVQRKINDFNN